jgi:drug/metabolite transporter (DMT)-like permease
VVVEGVRATPTVDLLWTLVFTGLGATGVANAAWFTLLRRYAAVIAAAPIFLVPVFAVVFGVLVLGEELPVTLLAGGVVTLAGIVLVTRNVSTTEAQRTQRGDGGTVFDA